MQLIEYLLQQPLKELGTALMKNMVAMVLLALMNLNTNTFEELITNMFSKKVTR